MYYANKYWDNIWTDMERLPDGKTYYASTDAGQKLSMNPDTLEFGEVLKWEDDLNCILGVTHSKTHPDGSMYSICPTMSETSFPIKNSIIVYKMDPTDPLKRIAVATIETKNLIYQHSFGLSKDYAMVVESPMSFNVEPMMLGHPMIDCMEQNQKETTKIHAIKLSDGTVTTFETNRWSFVMH